ncbi:MAG TPA: ADOP family duplicated permease [Gemmatimonadaceae bacterium]
MMARRPAPPAVARALLSALGSRENAEFLIGDLDEEFDQRVETSGVRAAKWWYRAQVAASIGPLVRLQFPRATAQLVRGLSAARKPPMQPFHHGLLQIVRNARSSSLTIGIAGLAIGASTGIGTIVDRAVFRPLPYPEAEQLVVVYNTYPGWRNREVLGRFWDRIDLSWPEYAALRARPDVFQSIAIHSSGTAVHHMPDRADVVQTGTATHELLRVLGTAPALGRWFEPDEDLLGAAPAVVVSHAFWRTRLGSDSSAVGRFITLDGKRHSVIGVMPDDFSFRRAEDAAAPDVWLALGRFADPDNEGNHGFRAVARLQDGVTPPRALVVATSVLRGERSPAARGARVIGVEEYERGGSRHVMVLFAVSVGLLLLLACATVAALQLTRIVTRTREFAIRRAVGATSARLALQLLAENVIIGMAGGVIGVFLAHFTIAALVQLLPAATPGIVGAGVDARTLVLTLALSLGTAVIFGLAPLLHVVRSTPSAGLGSDRATRRSPALLILVGVQSALAVMLVVGAVLLLRTARALDAVEPGFAVGERLTFAVQLPPEAYSPERALQWHNELGERIRTLPGVRSVAGTSLLPLSGSSSSNSVWLQSYGPESGPKPEVERRIVTPNWFAVTGVPLLSGRVFDDADDEGSELVMLVSRTAAKQLWRDRQQVGDRVELSGRWWRVIGVVEDVLDRALEAEPVATVYVPASQWKPLDRQYVVHVTVPPLQIAPSIRSLVRELDGSVPVRDLRTLADVASAASQPQRARATIVAAYAVIATLLALTGLGGITSYSVRQRKREFAIRAALGARGAALTRLAMRQSVLASLGGIGVGLVLAIVFAGLLREFLFGVPAVDPISFGVTTVGLVLVSLAASGLPSLAAGRIDPAERLRRD